MMRPDELSKQQTRVYQKVVLLDVPNHWKIAQLGTINTYRPKTINPLNFPDEIFEYYSIPAFQEQRGPKSVQGRQILSNKFLISNHTVLFGKLNPRILKVWLVDSKSKNRQIASTEFIPICANDDVESEFIYYLCHSHFVVSEAKRLVSGSTPSRQRVDPKSFSQIYVPIPPRSEQQAIATILKSIQEAKAARQREIELENERKATLMQYLFTGGTRAETTNNEIGEVSSSWDVKTPQELLDADIIGGIQDGNHGDRHPVQSDFQSSGIPFLTADCIRGGEIDFHHAKYLDESWLDRLRVGFAKPGDVLLTHKGTVGETSIVNKQYGVVILSPQVTYYRIKDSRKLYPKYLFAVFQSTVFRSQLKRLASTQSTRAYVGITKQKKIAIPIPKFAEQVKIATILSACDKKSVALDHERALLAELFEALLGGLMTGRLLAKALTETERNE